MRATSIKSVKRACDECRNRKVKCDGILPQCSNCRMSDLQCKYDTPVRKRGPRPASMQHGTSRPSSMKSNLGRRSPSTSSRVLMSPESSTSTPGTDGLVVDPTLLRCGLSSEAVAVYHQLVSTLHSLYPDTTLETLVSKCIDIFMQYLFPLGPLVHEPTLRANLSLLPAEQISTNSSISPASPTSCEEGLETASLFVARTFALLTAVCAFSTCRNLEHDLPSDAKLFDAFLNASKKMLSLYHEEDIRNPTSSSVIIRLFHATTVHIAGKPRLSWFMLGEAIRISQDMRLHTETSLVGLEPIEAQLRRNVFWQLYVSDRSAAILNNRPFTLSEFNFETPMSLSDKTWEETPLTDTDKDFNTPEFEHRIATGFQMCQKLWTLASNLLFELRLVQRQSHFSSGLSEAQTSTLTNAYLEFVSVLDNTPLWLRNPEIETLRESSILSRDALGFQSGSFWAQNVNLQVTFHFLRLMVLQKFADCSLCSILGVSQQSLMLSLKKTEIAQDMLRVIQNVPFQALKANGESCVEKIRHVAAALLEIAQNVEAPQIAARARADFSLMLDIIARLDSKLSDTVAIND